MKRFLYGFTLAEVLISIAILGVIAAMTMPNLMINLQKQQAGPALAKAINTLETANKLAISDEGVRRLDHIDTGKSSVYLNNILAPYVAFTVESSTKSYKSYSGESSISLGTTRSHTTKDGITFISSQNSTTANANAPLGYTGAYYTVYVDVNGYRKGPNLVGKDLFRLDVDANGTVLPYGSTTYKAYTNSSDTWTTKCKSNTKQSPEDAWYCAGAIADNGFRVLY